MFLICGLLGHYKGRRHGIYFSRAPGGDHSGAGGLLRFKIQQGDANLRREHEPVRPERLLPGRQRGPLHAAERDHWCKLVATKVKLVLLRHLPAFIPIM